MPKKSIPDPSAEETLSRYRISSALCGPGSMRNVIDEWLKHRTSDHWPNYNSTAGRARITDDQWTYLREGIQQQDVWVQTKIRDWKIDIQRILRNRACPDYLCTVIVIASLITVVGFLQSPTVYPSDPIDNYYEAETRRVISAMRLWGLLLSKGGYVLSFAELKDAIAHDY